MSFHGMHPDIIFAEAAKKVRDNPYANAMNKFRRIMKVRVNAREGRKMMLANPARFGLTDAEIKAIMAIK